MQRTGRVSGPRPGCLCLPLCHAPVSPLHPSGPACTTRLHPPPHLTHPPTHSPPLQGNQNRALKADDIKDDPKIKDKPIKVKPIKDDKPKRALLENDKADKIKDKPPKDKGDFP